MKGVNPLPVVNQCQGCTHIFGNRCRIYFFPETKWIAGVCPMATHRKKAVEQEAKFVNPLKASKRKAKGK